MTRRFVPLLVAAAFSGLAASCGGSSNNSQLPAGFYITISNMAFSPLDRAVPPGATVTVLNRDSVAHTVTSEATPGAFTPGAVSGISFDTGEFTGPEELHGPVDGDGGHGDPVLLQGAHEHDGDAERDDHDPGERAAGTRPVDPWIVRLLSRARDDHDLFPLRHCAQRPCSSNR